MKNAYVGQNDQNLEHMENVLNISIDGRLKGMHLQQLVIRNWAKNYVVN